MKKITILTVLIINTIFLQAQFISTYTSTFDSIFSNVSRIDATTGILYERVIPFAQLYNFNSNLSNSVDTSDMQHFLQTYFGLFSLDSQQQLDFMEIVEDRHARKATIIASQLPVANWFDLFKEATLADAILDRIVHTSHRVELKGESLRKKQ